MLFRTPAGARAGLAALKRAIAPGGTALHWPEFGADSRGATVLGQTPFASYAWRMGNVVLLATSHCDVACDFDVVPVNRAYARALNANARRK